MKINRNNLNQAASQGLISTEQADDLWAFLSRESAHTPAFTPINILYYLGASIAIGAMTIFINFGSEWFGGKGIAFISLAYAIIGIAFAEHFHRQQKLPIPTGIMATLAVTLIPLGVYGIQKEMGLFDSGTIYNSLHRFIDRRWIIIELATLTAGLLALWRYRLGIILMPISAALFYLSMDLAHWLITPSTPKWTMDKLVATWFGLGMLVIALITDLKDRSDKDYAFWLYLFGVMTLWGGVMALWFEGSRYNNSLSINIKLLYLGFNLLLIAVGACLMRKVFVVFGAIGILIVLGNLSGTYFRDSVAFPFTLTILGLLTVALGIWWQRHSAAIQKQIAGRLPNALLRLRERSS
jgi:hypothetical protein